MFYLENVLIYEHLVQWLTHVEAGSDRQSNLGRNAIAFSSSGAESTPWHILSDIR